VNLTGTAVTRARKYVSLGLVSAYPFPPLLPLQARPATRSRLTSTGERGHGHLAMVLNGLGYSNRQLYLAPQFFAHKPVEHLLEPGIRATDLNDDCLGRTLDWLYAHDVTALFAGLALLARRAFGVPLKAQTRLHADTTSFAVSGAYLPKAGDLDAQTIAVTYGYARDHRVDLTQWILTLDGNASDKATLPQVIVELTR
jgi:transposase